MESPEIARRSLKSDRWEEWRQTDTAQKSGEAMPPLQKPYPEGATLIDLVAHQDLAVGDMPLRKVIARRRSRRQFTGEPLSLEELSFLLWATQGISQTLTQGGEIVRALRTVPSAGARHPFETYLLVNRIEGLETGLYRYLPLEHRLLLLQLGEHLVQEVHAATYDQYVLDSAVVFIWTTIPYRTEWRYSFISHKVIAQDSGHLCQNLYLASEAVGAGTCAIGAYDQDKIDAILGVDGKEEFTIYIAPVGRIA
jgi:SagB-type dehydrogenase family enzyme